MLMANVPCGDDLLRGFSWLMEIMCSSGAPGKLNSKAAVAYAVYRGGRMK